MKTHFARFSNTLFALGVFLFHSRATAADGTWLGTSGDWGLSGTWSGGTIADGADFTANFTGTNITANQIINLDSDRTIGNITFTDATTASHNLTISGANILTLDRTDATAPIIDVTQSGRALTISSQISGSDGFQKNGLGTLTLSNTNNNYTGGTILNAGTISFGTNSDVYLGAASSGLTFNGGQISYSDGFVLNRNVTVDSNVSLANAITVNGVLSGNSSISMTTSDSAVFNNTANTFTGTVNTGYAMSFASLGDSSNAVNFGNSSAGFTWTGSARTFADRVFTLNAAGNGQIRSSGTGALVIQQNLAITGAAGARALFLGGANTTSTNQFAGNIADGTGSAVSLTKENGNSIWALSGTNTYTGATTMAYSDDNGILIFQGMQALSSSTSLNQNQGSLNTRAGTIRLLDDSSTPASRSGVNLNFSNIEGVGTGDLRHWMRVFVGNNSIANLGTSSSTQTGSTIQLGNLNLTEGATASTGGGLWVTGANGYRLQIADVNVTLQAGTTSNHQVTLRADNSMTVTGTVRQANDAGVGSTTTLQLEGGATGSLISGNILNSAGGRLLNVSKAGTGDWTLSGTNSYTGTTSVSVGKLLITGDSSAATGNVAVSGGFLGGTGSLGGAVTVSSTGGIDLRDGAIGNLTLGSTLSITGAAGANNLYFDLGNATNTTDKIIAGGATTVTTAGAAVITLNQLGSTAGRNAAGTYTLIQGSTSMDLATDFTLATTKAFGQTFSLGVTGNNLELTTVHSAAGPAAAFWKGGDNNWSTASNWNTDATSNVGTGVAPDYQTNVTFSTTTPAAANLTTNVLDVDFDINSLTITNASGNVTIGGTKMLTIEAAAVNGNTLGNGIDSQKTSGTNTISAKVGLASSQTWTVATGGTLAVSGAISDFGAGYGLTKAGGGTLTLTGATTYTGGTTITGGILSVNSTAVSAINSGPISLSGGGRLTLSGANLSSTSQVSVGTGGGILFVNKNNNFTTSGKLTGSGQLTLLDGGGGGTLSAYVFNATNNDFTGGIVFSGQATLSVNSLADSANNIVFNATTGSSTFSYGSGAGAPLTLASRAIEINSAGALTATIQNNSTLGAISIGTDLIATGAGAKVLGLGAVAGTSNVFSGVISDGTDGGTIAVTKTGVGIWSLSNTNTYSGATTISGGTLSLGDGGTTGSLNTGSAISVASGAVFAVNQSDTVTQGTHFSNAIITGAGGFSQLGSGTTVLNLANTYSGSTTLRGGTLSLTNALAIQNSALVITDSGFLTLGGGITTPTFGGLSSSGNIRDLATVISSGYSGVTNLTLNPQSGVSVTYAGVISDGATGMTLTKTGAGTQVLTGSNTFTGDVLLNAGTVSTGFITNGSLAYGTGANIRFTGDATLGALHNSGSQTLAKNLIVDPGVTANISTASAAFGVNFTGVLSGSGTLNIRDSNGSVTFSNSANTFTGALILLSGGATGNVNSLADSANQIRFDNATSFSFAGGAGTSTSLLFNSRQIVLGANGTINNNNTDLTKTFTVNTALGFSGTVGARALTLGGSNAGVNAFNGNITNYSGSAVSLTKSGTGTWILGGANSYSGTTTINDGILSISSIGSVSGSASSIGTPSSAANGLILMGTGNSTGTLLYTGSGHSSDRTIQINSSVNTNTGGATIINNGTGALTFSATTFNAAYVNASAVTRVLTLDGSNGGQIQGVIQNNSATNLVGITKSGIGSWTLSGTNTNTGATGLNGGGTLVLDYATNNTNKIAGVLTLGGGTLELSGGSYTEVVTSTSLSAGGNIITQTNSGSSVLQMGAITRTQGSTISFTAPSIATTTTANNAGGILGGWATVGSHWAVNSGGNVVALSSYETTVPTTGGVATTNYQLTGGQTQTGTLTGNSLRLVNGANSDILDLNTRIINAGSGHEAGLLYAGGFDNNYTISGTTGVIKSATANNNLSVNVFQGTLTIDALLNSGTASTLKYGDGTLVMGGANTWTGALLVQAGVARLTNSSALGGLAGANAVQNGAALELSNSVAIGAEALNITGMGVSSGGALRNVASNTSSYAGAITIGAGGARINSDAGGALTLSGGVATSLFNNVTFGGAGSTTVSTAAISGAGGVIKDGNGILTLSATNTYTGATLVSAGTLFISGSLVSDVTVSDGATLAGGGTVDDLILGGGSLFDIFLAVDSSDSLAATNISFAAGGFGIDNLRANGSAVDWGTVSDGIYTLITGTLNSTNLENFGSGNAYDLGGGRSAYFQNGSLQLVVETIPEPKTALLGVLGVLLLLRRRR